MIPARAANRAIAGSQDQSGSPLMARKTLRAQEQGPQDSVQDHRPAHPAVVLGVQDVPRRGGEGLSVTDASFQDLREQAGQGVPQVTAIYEAAKPARRPWRARSRGRNGSPGRGASRPGPTPGDPG
jgi:hypothetical protein